MHRAPTYLLLISVLLWACASDDEPAPVDAAMDASNDASEVDAAEDAAPDSSDDAASDASSATCADRSAVTCTDDDSCRAVYARLDGQPDDEGPTFIVCLLDDSCGDGDAVTCAENDASGQLAAFTTTCVPPGWTRVDCDYGEDAGAP